MLYKNQQGSPKPPLNPPPRRERRDLQEKVTAQTHQILHELRRKLGRTQQQTSLDKYIEVIGPRFALDNMGADRIPIQWKPGMRSFKHHWWHTFQVEVVSRLVMTYFDRILEARVQPWEQAMARLREMLDTGIHNYKLAPLDKSSFTLLTQKEWDAEKQRRLDEEQAKADKLAER